MAAKICAETGKYEGIACVGAVIRGETSHYDYVCTEAARGIQDVQLRTGVPCGFGVLTVDNYAQALERLGEKRHQGADAARAVLALAALKA
jgi:6,7-dimethyl-8-ribityllumazine synthase